jgi:hypothetical protein
LFGGYLKVAKNSYHLQYGGVVLSDLGKKNYWKLFNPVTGKVDKPPEKRCKGTSCGEFMDWKTTGQLCVQRNGRYTYQQYCKGCRKTDFNDIVSHVYVRSFIKFKRPPRVLVFALFLSWFKRPPRVLEYAVGYAWRDTNGFGTNYYFLLIYVSFTTTMTIE